MADIRAAKRALVTSLLDGPGRAPNESRRAAFANQGLSGALAALVDKVALNAHRIEDADFAAVRAHHSEDELFELVVCAAVGQASRQWEAALAALQSATAGGRDATRDP